MPLLVPEVLAEFETVAVDDCDVDIEPVVLIVGTEDAVPEPERLKVASCEEVPESEGLTDGADEPVLDEVALLVAVGVPDAEGACDGVPEPLELAVLLPLGDVLGVDTALGVTDALAACVGEIDGLCERVEERL